MALIIRHEDGFAVCTVEKSWAEDGDSVFVGFGGYGGDFLFAQKLAEEVEEFVAAVAVISSQRHDEFGDEFFHFAVVGFFAVNIVVAVYVVFEELLVVYHVAALPVAKAHGVNDVFGYVCACADEDVDEAVFYEPVHDGPLPSGAHGSCVSHGDGEVFFSNHVFPNVNCFA